MENLKTHTKIKRLLLITLGVLFFASCLAFYDITIDLESGVIDQHIYHELRVFIPLVIALIGAGIFYYKFESELYESLTKKDYELLDLKDKYNELSHLNEILKQTLMNKISLQFEIWKLTPTEKEVGLLLIKGYSSKEIADARKTVEKTVREQASSIYHKAGLRNRADLTSYFIEDIL